MSFHIFCLILPSQYLSEIDVLFPVKKSKLREVNFITLVRGIVWIQWQIFKFSSFCGFIIIHNKLEKIIAVVAAGPMSLEER